MDVDGERAAKKMRMASRSRSQSVPRDVAGHAYKDKTQQEKAKKVRGRWRAPPLADAQMLSDHQEGSQERDEGEGQGDGKERRGRPTCPQLQTQTSPYRQARDRQDGSALRACGTSEKLEREEERSRRRCRFERVSLFFVYPHLVKNFSNPALLSRPSPSPSFLLLPSLKLHTTSSRLCHPRGPPD